MQGYDLQTAFDFGLATVTWHGGRRRKTPVVDLRACRTVADAIEVFGFVLCREVAFSAARVDGGELRMSVILYPEGGKRGEWVMVEGVRKNEYSVAELSMLNERMMTLYEERIARLETSFSNYVTMMDWTRGCKIGTGLLECGVDLVPLGLVGELRGAVCLDRFECCRVGVDRYLAVRLRLSLPLLKWELADEYFGLLERYVRVRIVVLDVEEGDLKRCRGVLRAARERSLFELCGHVEVPGMWNDDKKWEQREKWCRRR
jgi:hypothetical protein